LILALLAVELLDELVFGAFNAAWPLIRADFRLTYERVGLLITLPIVVGSLVEPVIGILGDTGRRRALLVGGGIAFTASVAATSVAPGWLALLVALAVLNPASGAFVGLSQATLMDLDPERHEQNMARWVVAGSVGVLGGAGLVAGIARAGGSWRYAFAALAIFAAATLAAVVRVNVTASHAADAGVLSADFRSGLRAALRALRSGDVRRWLILLESADLMGDVLEGFLALYLVDVAHASAAQAAAGVALYTAVGLAGDAMLVVLLERVEGIRYLRVSVLLTIAVFPALLLVPTIEMKFVVIALLGFLNAGWYSIPKARLYAAMPGQSATVMTLANTVGLAGAFIPFTVGAIADRVGLGATMWLLIIGPLTLLVGLPRRPRPFPTQL
jgi:FSR family fosmidomycin resistance protein-like MFS transporter